MAYTNFQNCTEEEYNEIIYSGDARHKLKLLFNGVEYSTANSKTESLKRTAKILSDGGERFSLDNFKSQTLELTIHDIDLEDIIEPISISIGTLVDSDNNTYEYVPIGVFNLDETPTTNSGKTTIKMSDNAVKFDFPYNAQEVIEANDGSASMLQILQDICTKAGVTLETTDFPNKDTYVSVWDNSINARQYVMYIAEKAGRIAAISRTGSLVLINLQNSDEIELDPLLFEKYTEGDLLEISRVVYEDAIRKFEYGDETAGTLYINSSNPYIVDTIEIQNVYNQMNGFNIYSMNISKMIGNPAIDPWDIIKFTYNDKTYKTLGQNILTYNGVIIHKFDTQIGTNEKSQENVTINSEDNKFKRLFTRMDQAEGNIELNSSQIISVQSDLEQNYFQKEETEQLILNSATGVTNTFSEAGGNNIFHNTGLFAENTEKGEIVELSSTNGEIEINNAQNSKVEVDIKGNTYQQTYTGKNLLDCSHTQTSNGIVSTYNSNGTLSFSGTPTSTWANITQRISMNLPAGTYTLSIQEPISTGFVVRLYHDNSNYTDIGFGAGTKKITRTINSAVVSSYIWIHTMTVGQAVNVTGIKAQLESGSNATSWEKYVGGTASPNPDYPQSIENVTGLQTIEVVGKNLMGIQVPNTTLVGITFKLENGLLQLNGTTTGASVIYNSSSNAITLPAGSYRCSTHILSGTFTSGSNDTAIYLYNKNTNVPILILYKGNNYSSTPTFNLNEESELYLRIYTNGSGFVFNNLVIQMQIEKGTESATDFEEYKGQKYEINLGKNLFDKDTMVLNAAIDGGTGYMESSDNFRTIYFKCKPSTTYTIQKIVSNRFVIGYTNDNNVNLPKKLTYPISPSTSTTKYTFTTPSTANYCCIMISKATDDTANINDILDSIQIEVGSQATSYSEYFTPIELCKINDYQDRIYKQNNKWYIEKKIGKYVFTGTESSSSFEKINSVMSGTTRFIYNMNGIYQTNTSKVVISNCFKSATFDEIYSGNTTDKNLISSFVNISRFVMRIDNTIANSIDEFKTWLGNNNVEVDYVLATPEIIEITNTDLIEQLENIKTLTGYNRIILNSNIDTEFNLKYELNTPFEFWEGYVLKYKEEKASNSSALLLQKDTLVQEQEVPNGNYTVSFKYKKLIELATVKVFINDVEYELTETEDTEFVTGARNNEGEYITQPLIVNSRHINVKFTSDTMNSCEIYDLMVNAGTVKLAYSQNQNETTTETVNISKGITIVSSTTNTKFRANSDGVRIFNKNDTKEENPITKFTDTGTETTNLKVDNEATVVDILIQRVGNHTWFTKI